MYNNCTHVRKGREHQRATYFMLIFENILCVDPGGARYHAIAEHHEDALQRDVQVTADVGAFCFKAAITESI